jgi:two-component system CheB/CheR fusion protein
MDLLLVIFEDAVQSTGQELESDKNGEINIAELQKELNYTRKNLQSTIEEMEITLEEITSTNEEVQSTNEELQSANEELTTSKEEMQSMNEELTSLNTELQFKVGEFFQVNNDMKNFLQNADSAILFLDNNLNIKKFSPGAAKIIKLIASDVGRPITDIVNNILHFDLGNHIEEVMENLVLKEFEVTSNSEEWYRIRISPYRTINNFIEGTVILFTNITETKKLNEKLQHDRHYTEKVMEAMGDALIVMDGKFRIQSVNNAFYTIFRETSGNILNKNFLDLRGGQWNIPPLHNALVNLAKNNIEFNDLIMHHHFEYIGHKSILINGRIVQGSSNDPCLVLLIVRELASKPV